MCLEMQCINSFDKDVLTNKVTFIINKAMALGILSKDRCVISDGREYQA